MILFRDQKWIPFPKIGEWFEFFQECCTYTIIIKILLIINSNNGIKECTKP